VEKVQVRWIAAAAVGLALGIPAQIVLDLMVGADQWLQVMPIMVSYLCLSLFTGVAILRHHLYGIDILLNRSIVLTVLTGSSPWVRRGGRSLRRARRPVRR
jgi:hypothetical protein